MSHLYALTEDQLKIDPRMLDFDPTLGPQAKLRHTPLGQEIEHLYTSYAGITAILASIRIASQRQPVVAVEPFLLELAGEGAFTDEFKQYAGRIMRAVVERLGGRLVGSRRVVGRSRYASGSIYTFDDEDLQDLSDAA